jgi:DNA transformation protein
MFSWSNVLARQNEFVDYLLELLSPLGGVASRAMFGGHGIYKDGLIFGIVIDDAFHLKADDVSRKEFDVRGLKPSLYESKNKVKVAAMSYYQCPEEALESSALMLKWANRGIAAALRAAAKKTLKKERERNPAKT